MTMVPTWHQLGDAIGFSLGHVVNYNGRSDLRELFDSLKHQTRPADEVILVDKRRPTGARTMSVSASPGCRSLL